METLISSAKTLKCCRRSSSEEDYDELAPCIFVLFPWQRWVAILFSEESQPRNIEIGFSVTDNRVFGQIMAVYRIKWNEGGSSGSPAPVQGGFLQSRREASPKLSTVDKLWRKLSSSVATM